MLIIELLQQVGLNKYEAEAYAVLLREGPLTGYEVAKRSAVPLSRSYEVLERLHGKGLVLAQPGEPARYAAEDPTLLLGQVRRHMKETLDGLEALLPAWPARNDAGFWVVRGRDNILARARAMIDAGEELSFLQVGGNEEDVLSLVTAAQRCGLRVTAASPGSILLLVDGETLVGTLAPADRCQAIVSRNPGLVEVLGPVIPLPARPQAGNAEAPADWLTWELEKQRSILHLDDRRNSA